MEERTEGQRKTILTEFTLYETRSWFYLIGTNTIGDRFRVLKIDRSDYKKLNIMEDNAVYSSSEITEVLEMVKSGNKSFQKVLDCCGILGFVRFLESYYIVLVTRRSEVGVIGGHYIYHVDDTALIPIVIPQKTEKRVEESRYFRMFTSVLEGRNFYFSYEYDLTNTLQYNMTIPAGTMKHKLNDMFIWNYHLLTEGINRWESSDWVIVLIHGFISQSKICVFGRNVYITIIARRSRHFAGARYYKRGVNDKGKVANEVESEQIAFDAQTTSFHYNNKLFGNPRFTSFVQHRGSIPLYWSQEANNLSPKPEIKIDLKDPFYCSAALHFDHLIGQYGTPLVILNLVKSKEKTKRESILLEEFTRCVKYLHQFLPNPNDIRYIAWDMSNASKSHDQNVIGVLEDIAEEVVEAVRFFHSGFDITPTKEKKYNKLQKGVIRTNCIDCLDRTNAAQFVIGKCALGYQLYELGIIPEPTISFDTDSMNLFNSMFHDHGNTIALQYGGSHLVNTMETYRKISDWTSHSRDMLETFKRYLSNSFTDAEKQDAINLFLGNFVPKDGAPMIWELETDHYLHNDQPCVRKCRRSYTDWWTHKDFFREISDVSYNFNSPFFTMETDDSHGWFRMFYQVHTLTSFNDLFPFNMTSTLTERTATNPRIHSPFVVRALSSQPSRLNIDGVKRWLTLSNRRSRKSKLKKSGPGDLENKDADKVYAEIVGHHQEPEGNNDSTRILEGWNELSQRHPEFLGKSQAYQAMYKVVSKLVHPYVTRSEEEEYRRYISQFQHVTLTFSSGWDDYALQQPNEEPSNIPAARSHQHPEYLNYANYVRNFNFKDPLSVQTIISRTPPKQKPKRQRTVSLSSLNTTPDPIFQKRLNFLSSAKQTFLRTQRQPEKYDNDSSHSEGVLSTHTSSHIASTQTLKPSKVSSQNFDSFDNSQHSPTSKDLFQQSESLLFSSSGHTHSEEGVGSFFSSANVPSDDLELYHTYVQMGQSIASGKGGGYGDVRGRYEAYYRWLRTGTFSVKTGQPALPVDVSTTKSQ